VSFTNQISDFEPMQRKSVALAELGKPFDRLFHDTAVDRHALPKERPQQSREAGILSGRLDPSPLGDFLFQGHSDVAQAALQLAEPIPNINLRNMAYLPLRSHCRQFFRHPVPCFGDDHFLINSLPANSSSALTLITDWTAAAEKPK
jgi:hypothetical protein